MLQGRSKIGHATAKTRRSEGKKEIDNDVQCDIPGKEIKMFLESIKRGMYSVTKEVLDPSCASQVTHQRFGWELHQDDGESGELKATFSQEC